MNYEMDGKVALVTGASGGIGRAAALAFARSRCVAGHKHGHWAKRIAVRKRTAHSRSVPIAGNVRPPDNRSCLFGGL